MLDKDIEKILISRDEIKNRCVELGQELTAAYADKNPLVVGVLKGAVPFMADIVREMDCYLELDFMDVSSYGNAMISSGEVKIIKDLDTNVEGRDLLIVEKRVELACVLPKTDKLLSLLTVCSSLYSPTIR